jgi:hypothetical protein
VVHEDAGMDHRLRLAVDASLAWYDDVFALNGIPATRSDGLWRALGTPPPYHSAVKTIVPGVPVARVLAAAASFEQCSVADSFGELELPGFTRLFDAVWVHAAGGSSRGLPAEWSVVTSREVFASWVELHDYVGVLPSRVLDEPRFTVLGRFVAGDLVGGAILHDAAEAVGLSNAWSADGDPLDWSGLLDAVRAVHPGRPVTDYASGDDLAGMLDAGFEAVGPHVVWFS